MKHNIPHDLDVPKAKIVVDKAFDEYKNRFADYHPTLHWANDRRADISFNAKGIKLNGAMHVEDKAIGLELDVPFLFKPFQKKAIEVIEREVNVWLDKARKGQL
jgi:hypothetical protein